MKMEKLNVLIRAEQLSNDIWPIVHQWGAFARDTVGKQMVRAADSIGANIAESFGRFHFGEKINFLYYARGSLFETKYWINQCHNRGLIDTKTYTKLTSQLEIIGKQLNSLIKTTKSARNSGQVLKETQELYQTKSDSHLLTSTDKLAWLDTQIPKYQLPITPQREARWKI